MEQAFRDAVSEKEFEPALDRLYEPYGKPLDAEYKMQEDDTGEAKSRWRACGAKSHHPK